VSGAAQEAGVQARTTAAAEASAKSAVALLARNLSNTIPSFHLGSQHRLDVRQREASG
jgi:hypothetical protein